MHNLVYTRSVLNKMRDRLFKGIFRARFRYDVFISYSRDDAKDYAVKLKEELSSLDFACFIDEEESPPGLSLEPTLEKALKKSAILVDDGASVEAALRCYGSREVYPYRANDHSDKHFRNDNKEQRAGVNRATVEHHTYEEADMDR